MSHNPQSYPVDVVFDQTKMEQIDVWYLLKRILGPPQDTVPDVSFSYAVIAQFLYSSPFLTPSVWRALLEHMDVMLQVASRDHAMRLEVWDPQDTGVYQMKPLENSLHDLYQIIFVDAQWVTWTGETRFMGLQTGEMQGVLETPGVEQVAYNLTELTRREHLRCLALLKKQGVA